MSTNTPDSGEAGDHAPADTVRQRIFLVVLVATMGALAFGYDTGIISGALPYMTSPPDQGGLGLNSFTEGLVASSLVFGAAIGSFLSGFFSDRFGRRITLRSLAVNEMVPTTL
jgi:MFS family permease